MEAWWADIIHSVAENQIQYLANGFLLVNNGKIVSLSSTKPAEAKVIYDYRGKLLLPGLIDCHTHLPQYAFAGIGTPGLLQWLNRYTFPEEQKFADTTYARKVARAFFKTLLKNGTTTVCSFLTIHEPAAHIAFEEASHCGIRAFLGLTLMDCGTIPNLLLTKEEALKKSLALIQKWHLRDKLQFVVSPRFALSCTPALLREAGRMASDLDLLIQTHLSENKEEISATLQAYPSAKNYTEVYLQHELLNERSLLGHCIHLTEEEMLLLAQSKAVAVHCPTSNQFLMSGIMPLAHLRAHGVRVALGSDVAGGYELNMLHEVRLCMESSKTLTHLDEARGKPIRPPVTLEQAFYYATLGAASALRLQDKVGNFEKGKEADFILIDDSMLVPENLTDYQTLPERLSRVIYRLNSCGVLKTVIAGQVVYDAEEKR